MHSIVVLTLLVSFISQLQHYIIYKIEGGGNVGQNLKPKVLYKILR